jgi:hypothetical protein
MDQKLPPSLSPGLFASIGAGLGFVARLLIGAVVICVASFVAMMTAFAGLMLAGAALMMRFVAVRQPAPGSVTGNGVSVTVSAPTVPIALSPARATLPLGASTTFTADPDYKYILNLFEGCMERHKFDPKVPDFIWNKNRLFLEKEALKGSINRVISRPAGKQ